MASTSKVMFKSPARPLDFLALARNETSCGHNSFFAYNPEKEPIKVCHKM